MISELNDKPEKTERRWQQNRLVVGEMPGVPRAFWNVTKTPLDAYHHAGFISEGQYSAGDNLRLIWEKAGREPKLVIPLDERVGDRSHGEMSEAQSDAWDRLRTILANLEPVPASAVYNVCCLGDAAEFWAANKGMPAHVGLLVFRDALEALRRKS